MVNYRRRRMRRARFGATTLELALTLPVFLTLTVGVVEFGRGFMVQQMVTNAAREGARHGVLPGATNAEVTATVRGSLAAGSIDPNKVVVTVTPANLVAAKTGDQVKVQIRVAYNDAPVLLDGFRGAGHLGQQG